MMELNKLDSLMEQFIDSGVPGCALSVSYKGEVVFEAYKGYASIEQKKAIDENTLYRMFSNTKSITVVAAMILYERGKFLMNDPIEKYLPFFADMKYAYVDKANTVITAPVSRSIRIKDLFTMTSGLVYGGPGDYVHSEVEKIGGFFPKENLTTIEFIEELSKMPLAFDPGTHWNYGLSHDVLGALIEVLSGKSFSEFVREEIFKPLKMEKTMFRLSEETKQQLANLYRVEDKGLTVDTSMDWLYEPDVLYDSGGAGIVSSLKDMSRFTTMMAMGGKLDGERILGHKTIELMCQNHLKDEPLADFKRVSKSSMPWFEGYGYGLGGRTLIDKIEAGSNGSIGEYGWSGAAGTTILIDAKEELSVCYMHQLFPLEKSMQGYCHPRLRNTVYSLLD